MRGFASSRAVILGIVHGTAQRRNAVAVGIDANDNRPARREIRHLTPAPEEFAFGRSPLDAPFALR